MFQNPAFLFLYSSDYSGFLVLRRLKPSVIWLGVFAVGDKLLKLEQNEKEIFPCRG